MVVMRGQQTAAALQPAVRQLPAASNHPCNQSPGRPRRMKHTHWITSWSNLGQTLVKRTIPHSLGLSLTETIIRREGPSIERSPSKSLWDSSSCVSVDEMFLAGVTCGRQLGVGAGGWRRVGALLPCDVSVRPARESVKRPPPILMHTAVAVNVWWRQRHVWGGRTQG